MKEIYRHGDMILYKIEKDAIKASHEFECKKLKVGLGEVTGHSHDVLPLKDSKIKAYRNNLETVSDEDIANMNELFFEISGMGGIIVHEEHKPIYR